MQGTEISAEMRQRFERCAPAALARRSPAYLGATAIKSLQWVLLGALGLAGAFVWRWPPFDFVLLLLVACVAGMLADTLRWLLARKELVAQAERHNDDMFVWALVGALRHGQTQVDAGQHARYRAGVGVLLDWILGVAALVILARVFLDVWPQFTAYLRAAKTLQLALLVALLLPLAAGLVSLWSWRSADAHGATLEFGAGARGAFLLALAVVVLVLRNSTGGLFKLVVFLNAATLLLGLVAALGGIVLRNEADWLRRHLREAPPQDT